MTITGRPIDVGQGWPLAEDIDATMKAGRSIVTIYAVPGSGGKTAQVFDFDPDIVVAPSYGLTVSATGPSVTITGTSIAGEIVGLIIDGGNYFAHNSTSPESAGAVLAALLSQVQASYSQASVTGGVLSIPGSHSVVARSGGVGLVAQKIHRQTVQLRVVVWAPSPADRSTIGRAVDVALKNALTLTMPDTSRAIMTYEGTNLSDKEENAGVYRRDLIVSVLYDTINTYPATEIVSVPNTVSVGPSP